jgi:hypothetical protein
MNADAANASRSHARPGTYEAFLAYFVVDWAIAFTYWLYRAARAELVYPPQSQQVERTPVFRPMAPPPRGRVLRRNVVTP